MKWTFSLGWFIGGILIMIAGGLLVVFHRQIADNFANGVSSYDKTKIAGIIAVLVGLLCMTNLHTTLLYAIFHLIMPTVFK